MIYLEAEYPIFIVHLSISSLFSHTKKSVFLRFASVTTISVLVNIDVLFKPNKNGYLKTFADKLLPTGRLKLIVNSI